SESLESIQTRLVGEVLAVLETSAWKKSEYSIHVIRLNVTLNSLEAQLLAQYRSSLPESTNPSLEGIKNRFENVGTSWNNKFNAYLKDVKPNPTLYHYMAGDGVFGFKDFAATETRSMEDQVEMTKLSHAKSNYKDRLHLLNDLLSAWEKRMSEFTILFTIL